MSTSKTDSCVLGGVALEKGDTQNRNHRKISQSLGDNAFGCDLWFRSRRTDFLPAACTVCENDICDLSQ
jgi:hypothetical protein